MLKLVFEAYSEIKHLPTFCPHYQQKSLAGEYHGGLWGPWLPGSLKGHQKEEKGKEKERKREEKRGTEKKKERKKINQLDD